MEVDSILCSYPPPELIAEQNCNILRPWIMYMHNMSTLGKAEYFLVQTEVQFLASVVDHVQCIGYMDPPIAS